MFQHHEAALGKAIDRLKGEPDVSVVLLGGSIAKGTERPDSDVDLIVVVGDAAYAERLSQNRVTFFWTDLANWPGGYVEGRFVSRSFVLAAAERGSEPTRWSFTGVRAVRGDDPEILAAIPRIPVYPEADRERRMDAFMAQMVLYRRYFWPEGVRMGDPYLKTRSATAIVLFGVRLILAHNHLLFPNQKRLMETLAKCPSQPDGLVDLANKTLAGDEVAMHAFCDSVESSVGKRDADLGSRFTLDSEMSWFFGSIEVAEW